jgi:2-succinyl-5-enolpyruvyl-6-hydroxy-3-cyclohexene-1-carboxylate synthase
MTEANLLSEWARLFICSLADAGVRDAVVSPGSRSTPLVYALHHEPRLRLWDVIDERAAAFFALGQARVSGRPSLLVCTSGSAGAHYLPAVIEAGMAHLPLLVLTADRPFELQDCGASQTIDQIKLYGHHARRYIELGMPERGELPLRALRRVAAQAVLTTTWPTPGAVHLNARARKPLEPQTLHTDAEAALRGRVDALLAAPLPRAYAPRAVPDPDGVAAAAALCRDRPRGLILCGPAPLSQGELAAAVAELAVQTGYPLLADASSQLRFGLAASMNVPRCDAYEALLRCPGGLQVEDLQVLIQIGAPPIASGVEQLLLARPELPRIVLSAHAYSDPASSAQVLLLGEIAPTLAALRPAVGSSAAADPRWAAQVQRLDALALAVLQEQLAAAPTGPLNEAAAVRATVAELPPDSLLMIGNSLPIREVDALCPGTLARARALAQRGTSGIEGLIAGAAGAATQDGRPLTLLLGDISALHDLGSLALLARAPGPLVVVVVQNHGGRIFEQLPIGKLPAAQEDPALLAHFTTPHRLHLRPAAALYGLHYAEATDEESLRAALRTGFAGSGATLIEAVVPPSSAAAHQAAYYAALTAALARFRAGTEPS